MGFKTMSLKGNMKRTGVFLFLSLLCLTACGSKGNLETQSDSLKISRDNTENQSSGSEMEGLGEGQGTSGGLEAVSGEFTMENLIVLCADEDWAEQMEEEGIGFFLKYENFSMVEDHPQSTWLHEAFLPYGERTYRLEVEHIWPENAKESFPMDNAIRSVCLQEMETGHTMTIYWKDDEIHEKPDILSFWATEYNGIEHYLKFELPEGITLGDYVLSDSLWHDGNCFLSEAQLHNDQADDYFCKAGGIGVLDEDLIENLVYENGKLVDVFHPTNHGGRVSDWETIENEDFSVIMAEYNYDRFVASDMLEYEEKYGVELEEAEQTCDYWYVFIVNEGEEKHYMAYFHKNAFTKEQVVDFAKSIRKVEE